MAVTLIHTGRRPGQTQFGLDTFTESYKANDAADNVLTDGSVPQRGDAHPDFSGMFVTDRYCSETGPQSSALDVVYMGTLSELPPQQHESGTAVQSASSGWGSTGAQIGEVSVQFYAPTNVLTYISEGGPGTDEADDPSDDPVIITVQAGNANFAPGTTIANIAANYFSTQIVHSLDSTEIVAGQYWQNVSRKTKVFIPYLVSVPAGSAFVALAAPGINYAVGDVLTITDGGQTATMRVTALGISQSILAFETLTNDFTSPGNLLSATGGSGTGAKFNVIIV